MNDEINKLQELLAYQQQDISRLSDELFHQQRDIGKLADELNTMKESLKRMSEGSENTIRSDEEETPPPHY